MSTVKFCVLSEATLLSRPQEKIRGVFTWTGKTWHVAEIKELIHECPPWTSGKDLRRELKDIKKRFPTAEAVDALLEFRQTCYYQRDQRYFSKWQSQYTEDGVTKRHTALLEVEIINVYPRSGVEYKTVRVVSEEGRPSAAFAQKFEGMRGGYTFEYATSNLRRSTTILQTKLGLREEAK